MPNTLTSIFVSSPATEPVEAPHPNTGVYVTGTQAAAGGPWSVVHTLVTKTTTPLTMVGRLKNFPAVTVSVVASGGPFAGNIFNAVLSTPTGSGAAATSSTALNVVVSSSSNQTGYRLLAADAAAGPFTQIYQGTTASYSHTGLTAGQTKYYLWQYVGGGYYDDSALGAAFSGTTTAQGALSSFAIPNNAIADGALALAALGGFRRNTFSSFTFTLPAGTTQLNIQAASDLGLLGPYSGKLGVFVTDASANTVFSVLSYASSTAAYQPVTLPTTASTVRVVVSDLGRNGVNTQNLSGIVALLVQSDAVPTFTVAATNSQYVLLGDSILGGGGATQPFTDTVSILLRNRVQATARVTVNSVSGGSLNEFYGVAAPRASNLTQLLSEVATNGTLIIEYGTNDAGRNASTASVFGTNYGQLVDDIHASRADIRVVAQTPLVSGSYEALLETFRQQIRYAANTRPWLLLIEGPTLMGVSLLSADNVHPTTAGHAIYEANLWAALNTTAVNTPTATFKNPEFITATVADPGAGWVGGAGTGFAAGVLTFTNASGSGTAIPAAGQIAQAVKMVRGASYRIEFKINSISSGFVSLQSTGQNGQIHPAIQGAGTGGAAGIWRTEFVCLSTNETYYLRGNSACNAVVEYCTLTAIADLAPIAQNFDFLSPFAATAATGWAAAAGATITGGSLVFNAATSVVQQNIALTVGQRYRMLSLANSQTAGTVTVGSTGGQIVSSAMDANGLFSAVFTATAATETITITASAATSTLDYVSLVLLTPSFITPANPSLFLNSEFDAAATADIATGWVCGAQCSIGAGVLHFAAATGAGAGDTRQQITLTVGANYRLEMAITNISGGAVSLLTNSGANGQFDVSKGDATNAAGILVKNFACTVANDIYFVRGAGTTTADIDYVRITQI